MYYYIPKRKRHKSLIPKALLYSATILSAATSSVGPAVSIFAETQIAKGENTDQPKTNLSEHPKLPSRNTDTELPTSSQQQSDSSKKKYSIMFKDENGRIIDIDSNFETKPHENITKTIEEKVAQLPGNWQLANNNTIISTPDEANLPIIVNLKPRYNLQNQKINQQIPLTNKPSNQNNTQDNGTNTTNNQSNSQSAKVTNYFQFLDQNGNPIKSKNGKNKETVTGVPGTPVDPTLGIADGYQQISSHTYRISETNGATQNVILKKTQSVVQNQVKFQLNNQDVGQTTVSGTEGEPIDLDSKIPSGYKLENTPTFQADSNPIIVKLIVKDSTVNKNTIQFVNNSQSVGQPFDVYGTVGDEIKLGIFAPEGSIVPPFKFNNSVQTRKIDINTGNDIVDATQKVINKVTLKVSGSQFSKKVSISGNKDDQIPLNDYLPSGYSANDSLKFKENNAEQEVTIAPDEHSSLTKNTIQFVSNSQNVGQPFDVYGTVGDDIKLGIFAPEGSIVPPFKFNNSAQTRKIDVTTGLDVPDQVNVTNIIKFVDPTNQEITQTSVSGISGTEIDLNNLLPDNYEWINNSDHLINLGNNNVTINVKVQGKTYNNELIFTQDDSDSNILNTQNVVGRFNTPITEQLQIPTGYKLKDNQDINNLRIKTNNSKIKILVVRDENYITNQIQFTENGQNIGSPFYISGNLNDVINLTDKIPSGYELVDQTNSLKFTNSETEIKVALKKIINASFVSNKIQFVLEDGTQINDLVSISGNKGNKINLSSLIPSGYELVDNTYEYLFGDNDTVIPVKIQKTTKTINNYIQFTINGEDFELPKQVNGVINSPIDITSLLPRNYELVDKNTNFKIDGTLGKVQKVAIKGIQVTNKIKIIDSENKLIKEQSVNGEFNTVQTINNLLPQNYEWPQNFDPKITLTDDGSIIEVKALGKEYSNTLFFIDESIPKVLGQVKISGRFNTAVDLQSLTLPTGYKIKALLIRDSNELRFETPGSQLSLDLVKDDNYTSNKLQFTVNGSKLGNEIEVTGKINDPINLTEKIPNGYELDNSTTSIKYTKTNNIIEVPIHKLNDPTLVSNKIQFKDKDSGQNIGTPIELFGHLNDPINLASFIPKGCKLVGNIPTFKANASQLTIAVDSNIINYLQFTVDGSAYGDRIEVKGKLNSGINLTTLIPEGYELSEPQTYKIASDGKIQSISIKLKSTDTITIPKPTIVTNYLQFVVDDKDFGKQFVLSGEIDQQMNFSNLIPTGYQLINTNDTYTFGPEGTIKRIKLKKIETPLDKVVNYIQFTINGANYNEPIEVSGNLGNVINLSALIPQGYQLTVPNPTIKYDIEGTTHRLAIQKTVTSTTVSNYLQFTVDGQDFSIPIERLGKLGDQIMVTPWIPYGYELINPNLVTHFENNGTTHRIAIRKATAESQPQNNVTNYLQFTVDGKNYSMPISCKGEAGSKIPVTSWIPYGYELVNSDIEIYYGPDQTVHYLAIKKVTNPTNPKPNKQVTNWIQFRVNGSNYGIPLSMTGKSGNKIDINSLIPFGYELVNPNQQLVFGNDGDLYQVSIKKVNSENPNVVQNYIQFTVNGQNFGTKISRMGKLGEEIDLKPWIPQGYMLEEPYAITRFISDGDVIRVPLKAIAKYTPNNPSKSPNYHQNIGQYEPNPSYNHPTYDDYNYTHPGYYHHNYSYNDPGYYRNGDDYADPFYSNSALKNSPDHPALPQTGNDQKQSLALSALGLTTAGTAALWLNSRRKKNKHLGNPTSPQIQ